MAGSGSRRIAWVCACLASGPLYMIAATLASAVKAIPQPIVFEWQAVFQYTLLLIPAVLFGFFVAAIPLALLILLLSSLAGSFPPLRAPLAWTFAGGGAAGLLLFGLGEYEFSARFALVATGMASLRLARAYLDWPSDFHQAAMLGREARTL
jgi:hypothetical protein